MREIDKYKALFAVDESGRYYFYSYFESVPCSKEMHDAWYDNNQPNWYCINRRLYTDEAEFIRIYNLRAFM